MSLATRLSAFFLLALGLTLTGFSSTLYLLGRAYMLRHLDEHVVANLDALTASVPHGPDGIVWPPGRRLPPVALSPGVEGIFWATYDRRGGLLDHSANFVPLPPPNESGLEAHSGHFHVSVTGRDGHRYRLALRQVRTPEGGGARSIRTLVAGAPLAPMELGLGHLGVVLTLISLGLWLLAGMLGRRLSRRALAPLCAMARAARVMTAADRGQYLPSPGTGDELEGLSWAFNGLLDRLREALERQRRFTGDASHQLRTPLTAIIGNIEVALRRERPAAEYRQLLEGVHGDAVRLRQIVEALLFLSRAEAEARLPECLEFDLAEWLPEHLRRWSSHERSCDLHWEPEVVGPCRIRAHAPLLGQLLDNLLENACKYSQPGTPVRIRLRREGGLAVVVVEDSGCGLSAEELPHVFEPFYRSPEALRRGTPGSGLGLAVAQRIARAFRGDIAAEGEAGVGSRFILRLPEVGAAGAPEVVPPALPETGTLLGPCDPAGTGAAGDSRMGALRGR